MNSTFILQKDVIDELFLREEEFKNFVKFLKKNYKNYTLITDYENETEFQKHATDNPLLEILIDKFNKIRYVVDLKQKLEKKDIKNLSTIHSIALSNLDDEICNEYIEDHGILFFNLSTLNNWNKFSDIIFSKSLKVTKDEKIPANFRLTNFSDITKHFHYCNNLIIFDKFIFENKTNQKLINNLYPFLESILQIKKNMDIIIISEFRGQDILIHYNNLHKYLNQKGFNEFQLNLIHHNKAFYPKKFEGLHSRFILSNFIHIRSNDSFNFYKDNGDFNNLADIDIKFNLTNQNYYSYNKDLENVKIYLSKTKNEPDCPNTTLKTTFYRKKNNALIS